MLTSNFVLLRTDQGIKPFYYNFDKELDDTHDNPRTIQKFLNIDTKPNVLYPLDMIPEDINIIYSH